MIPQQISNQTHIQRLKEQGFSDYLIETAIRNIKDLSILTNTPEVAYSDTLVLVRHCLEAGIPVEDVLELKPTQIAQIVNHLHMPIIEEDRLTYPNRNIRLTAILALNNEEQIQPLIEQLRPYCEKTFVIHDALTNKRKEVSTSTIDSIIVSNDKTNILTSENNEYNTYRTKEINGQYITDPRQAYEVIYQLPNN